MKVIPSLQPSLTKKANNSNSQNVKQSIKLQSEWQINQHATPESIWLCDTINAGTPGCNKLSHFLFSTNTVHTSARLMSRFFIVNIIHITPQPYTSCNSSRLLIPLLSVLLVCLCFLLRFLALFLCSLFAFVHRAL